MRIVLLLSVVTLASAASLDVDQCDNGESFWCLNLSTAETCDKVEYCKETVWRTFIQEKEDSAESCLFCKSVISDLRNFHALGRSQDEIAHFLNVACDALPSATASSQCHYLVGSAIFQDVLSSNVRPEVACGLVGICHPDEDENDAKKEEEESKSPTETESETLSDGLPNSCPACKRFFTSLKSFLGNDTQAFLRDVAIDQLCPMMGQYRKQCEDIVKMYIPMALQIAVSFIDSDRICKQMKMCPKSEEFDQDFTAFDLNSIDWAELKTSDKQISEENSVKTSCSDCNKFFSSLKSFLGPDSQVFVKDVLLSHVCPTLRLTQQLPCRLLAKELLPRFIQSALQLLDPSTICKDIGMCQRSEEIFIMDGLLTAISIDQDDLLNDQTKVDFTVDQPSSCKDCVQFFNTLKGFLKTETVALIQDVLLDQVCSRTGTYKKQCEDLVKTYLPKVVSFSLNFLDPNKVCSAMKMCKKSFGGIDSSPMMEIDLSAIDWNELLGVAEGTPGKCTACKTAVQVVQKIFTSDLTKSIIKSALKIVCTFLGPARPICVSVVEAGVSAILDFVAKFLDPDKICSLIRLCPKQDSDPAALDQEQPSDSLPWNEINLSCESCESIVGSIVDVINANATERQNIIAMRKKCGLGKLATECRKFVTEFGKCVVNATVTEKLGPKEMCTKFKLCTEHISFNLDFSDKNQVL